MDYAKQNELGRQRAARLIEDCQSTGDMPRLVREMRAMAADDAGIGAGFLFKVAESLTTRVYSPT